MCTDVQAANCADSTADSTWDSPYRLVQTHNWHSVDLHLLLQTFLSSRSLIAGLWDQQALVHINRYPRHYDCAGGTGKSQHDCVLNRLRYVTMCIHALTVVLFLKNIPE